MTQKDPPALAAFGWSTPRITPEMIKCCNGEGDLILLCRGPAYRLTRIEPKLIMRGGSDILNVETTYADGPSKKANILFYFFNFKSFKLGTSFFWSKMTRNIQ